MGLLDEVVANGGEIVITKNGNPSLTLTASSTRDPAGAHAGASRKATAPVANRTARPSCWDDESPGRSHGRYAILVLTGRP